jgi:steroid delta-isomerase-like uncharacterized protein
MRRISVLLAALAVVFVGSFAAVCSARYTRAQVATPTALPPLVKELEAAWNAHDPERLAALHTDDAVVEYGFSGEVIARGRNQIAEEFAAGVFETYPDVRFETRSGYQSADLVVWEWAFVGSYTGREPGLPPGSGQPVSFRGVSLYELRDGLIVRKVFYTDDLTFLEQIGFVLVPPEATSAAGTPAA